MSSRIPKQLNRSRPREPRAARHTPKTPRQEMNAVERTIRAQAAHLRRCFNPTLPVRIYFRKEIIDEGVECEGLCRVKHRKGKAVGFSIFIKRGSLTKMSMVLVHEFAHALSWFEQGDDGEQIDDHDDVWALWQGRCYRALEDF